eukprot:3744331-Heterocapsa_arctica.AAC.1
MVYLRRRVYEPSRAWTFDHLLKMVTWMRRSVAGQRPRKILLSGLLVPSTQNIARLPTAEGGLS